MSRLAVDLTGYCPGKALGFNVYAKHILEGLVFSLSDGDELDVFVSPQAYEELAAVVVQSRLNFKPVRLAGYSYLRFIFSLLFLPFANYDCVLYPANFCPVLSRAKVVLVVHDLVHISAPGSFSWLKLRLKSILFFVSIRRADAIISISKFTSDSLYSRYFIPSRIIRNAVSFDRCVTKGVDTPSLIWPTSMAAHKNIEAGLKALGYFLDTRPDFKVYITGNWNVEEFVNSVHPSIVVLGFLERSDFNNLFRASSCIFLPSVYEGFGLPYIESALAGKYLVCSDISASRELFGESYNDSVSWISEPYDFDSICQALAEIPDDVHLYSFFSDFDGSVFSTEFFGQEYLSVMKDLL